MKEEINLFFTPGPILYKNPGTNDQSEKHIESKRSKKRFS